jgi:hypothetical protein
LLLKLILLFLIQILCQLVSWWNILQWYSHIFSLHSSVREFVYKEL